MTCSERINQLGPLRPPFITLLLAALYDSAVLCYIATIDYSLLLLLSSSRTFLSSLVLIITYAVYFSMESGL